MRQGDALLEARGRFVCHLNSHGGKQSVPLPPLAPGAQTLFAEIHGNASIDQRCRHKSIDPDIFCCRVGAFYIPRA